MIMIVVNWNVLIVYYFLFVFYFLEFEGVFVDVVGMFVLIDYQVVDWKVLVVFVCFVIDGVVFKGIQLFVVDDVVDVFEVFNFCLWLVSSYVGRGDFYSCFKMVVEKFEMVDMCFGIISFF